MSSVVEAPGSYRPSHSKQVEEEDNEGMAVTDDKSVAIATLVPGCHR